MLDNVTNSKRPNVAPIPFEADAPFLKITGELPRELNGTLYRNGPNPQFDSPGAHWFVGDGMLHAFHLEEGRASYRNRWVRTPKWLAEHDAGRALFGGFGRKLPDAHTNLTDGGVANTNVQSENGSWTFGTFVSKNSAISFNSAAGYGGGIFNTGKMDLRSTLFQDNHATQQGGAIWVDTVVTGTTCNVTRDTPSSAPSEFDANVADQGYGIISSAVPCSLHDSIGADNSSPYCSGMVTHCPQ